ncbi:uncharacterized protein PHACADRAFT_203421 [Phanerochaete carnosa HHB-10118-sp]|uniref:Uncharacterized protein n=1 Tax=Phanerochaete carnosa (strain HHB-10118-sp) TaxID=650164 RepID=K5VN06_PHACS|nr:uncharacterized protein PHACADRAFT_203421 [Phanerochaete carnosa HHB-10118-sp]EKM47979.1 hypothetical protein PHACADRAFT_203421 [Phanerochaete carnosa HHB-10118-sp]
MRDEKKCAAPLTVPRSAYSSKRGPTRHTPFATHVNTPFATHVGGSAAETSSDRVRHD